MPSTTDFTTLAAGYLKSRLASGATSGASVTVIEVNGSAITWPTGAHRIQVRRKTANGLAFETIGVASASQSGSTVTLGTLTRQMSMTDGSTFSTGGNGYTFPANSEVYVSWDVFDAERTMKDDKVNTITGAGAIRGNSTTVPIIRLNNVTTAQRTAMSAANGDMVYDTDLSAAFQYKGGAWVEVGDTGTAAATTTTLGTVELASTADIRAETATGDSGGPLAIPASATAVLKDDRIVLKDATELTIASGAITATQAYHTVDTQSDAASDDLDTLTAAVGTGEIVVLVAAHTDRTVVVKHNTGNIKLADSADFSLDTTEKSITLLKQAGNWIEIARGVGNPSIASPRSVYISGTTSTTLTNPTVSTAYDTHTFTIPASELVNGREYRWKSTLSLVRGTTGTFDFAVRTGGTDRLIVNVSSLTFSTTYINVEGRITGTTTAGASSAVKFAMSLMNYDGSGAGTLLGTGYASANLATNGDLVVTWSGKFNTSDGGNNTAMLSCSVDKASPSGF